VPSVAKSRRRRFAPGAHFGGADEGIEFLEKPFTPAELAADLVDRGIVLAGGVGYKVFTTPSQSQYATQEAPC